MNRGLKRAGRIALALVCALLLAASARVAGPARAEQKQLIINMPTGDLAARKPSQPMEMLSSADVDQLNEHMAGYTGKDEKLLKNRARRYYYYDNLEPVAKEIYDVMYGVVCDPASVGNIGLMMTFIDPMSDEYYFAFNVAYRAICFDHPELFWLYSGEDAELCYGSEAVNQNGFYFVYITMAKPYGQFEARMNEFNRAVDRFLADIDTSVSEYETVRQIHDKLIALVDYDTPVANHVSVPSTGQDLAHTAYGALVADSSGKANCAVCDGYSLAFEYLLQQCGIDVVFLGGMAGDDEASAGGHAWNMINVDGAWYEVDSTWDDWGNFANQLTADMDAQGYVAEALNDPQYRDRLDHYLFMVSTDRMRHFVPGDAYDYTTRDQRMVYTLPQESVHIRMSDWLSNDDPDRQIMQLAPVAMQTYPFR